MRLRKRGTYIRITVIKLHPANDQDRHRTRIGIEIGSADLRFQSEIYGLGIDSERALAIDAIFGTGHGCARVPRMSL